VQAQGGLVAVAAEAVRHPGSQQQPQQPAGPPMGWVTGTWAQRQAPAQTATAAPASAAGEPAGAGP